MDDTLEMRQCSLICDYLEATSYLETERLHTNPFRFVEKITIQRNLN